MAFLLETEFGAETNIIHWFKELDIDARLEEAMKNEVFRKYLNTTRLQASLHAVKGTQDNLKQANKKDNELIAYASFLKEQSEGLDERLRNYKAIIEEKKMENKMMKKRIRDIGKSTLFNSEDPEKSARIMESHSMEEIQLA